MDKLEKLLNDAQLHVKEAESKISEWRIKYDERLRIVNTIEIIKGKNDESSNTKH